MQPKSSAEGDFYATFRPVSRENLKTALVAFAEAAGFDEECGDLDSPPHKKAGLYNDAFDLADNLDDDEIEDEDLEFLRDQAGLVIVLGPGDTASVRYFADEDALLDHWEDVSADIAAAREQDTAEADV